MAVYDALVGGVSVNDGTRFAVAIETILEAESAVPETPVLVDMAARAPHYVRSQVVAREFSINLFLLDPSYPQRRVDYAYLQTLLAPDAQVPFQWTLGDSVVKTLVVAVMSIIPNAWLTRCSAVVTAANPFPLLA